MSNIPSPFIHDWPDPRDRERYELHAREVYVGLKENRRIAFEGHVGYGKWLIGALLALHAGSIYALMNLRSAIDVEDHGALITTASFNVFGIASILAAGFCAWLNFQIAEQRYMKWANPAMLYRNDRWPKDDNSQLDPINATLFLAAGCGIFSWVALIMGASELFAALRA